MPAKHKIIRTDRELETPHIDATLRAAGHDLTLLPDGISEDALIEAIRDAELLLMCYTPVTARVIAAADRLKRRVAPHGYARHPASQFQNPERPSLRRRW